MDYKIRYDQNDKMLPVYYRQFSKIRRTQTPNINLFSSRIPVVFVQSIEATC